MKKIDISNWKRKEYFEFFSGFDEPFFGIVSEVDCSIAYKTAKTMNFPFYAYYLHKSLLAVNQIQEFKYRIKGKQVVEFDKIHADPTISREDGTFSFGFIEFDEDFKVFNKSLINETKRVRATSGIGLDENTMRIDTIHYSTLPWINFTGLTHARNFKSEDSVPKITFGKFSQHGEKIIMPVSINAHHGLVDGLHVGQFIEKFQSLLNMG